MVDQLKTEQDVEVDWRPYLLRPDMPPEGMRLPDYLRKHNVTRGEHIRQRARAVGLDFIEGERVPNTRRALEASEYARENGLHETFHRIVFRKFYGEGQDIGDWQVLRAAAGEAGLDADEMQTQTESGAYTQRVVDGYMEALAIGVTSIPTYILDRRYAIIGAQPYEVFRGALDRLEADDSGGAGGDSD